MGLAYHTELYLFVFLPLVVLVYHFSSQKVRRAVLILAGYLFFWSFSRWMVLYLIAVSGLIYGAGRWMEHLKETGRARAKEFHSKERSAIKKQYKAKEKRVLMAGIIILLGILAYLKYCNFFIQNRTESPWQQGMTFTWNHRSFLFLSVFPFIHLRQSAIWPMYTGAGSKRSITGRRWHFSLDSFHRSWRDRSAAGRIQQMLSGNADRFRARIL